MRPDEPGPWELYRSLERMSKAQDAGFAQINDRLGQLVTTEVFTAEQRRVDEKIRDLVREIVAEREARKADIAEVETDLKDQAKVTTEAKRWAIGVLISGAGVAIALVSLIALLAR